MKVKVKFLDRFGYGFLLNKEKRRKKFKLKWFKLYKYNFCRGRKNKKYYILCG